MLSPDTPCRRFVFAPLLGLEGDFPEFVLDDHSSIRAIPDKLRRSIEADSTFDIQKYRSHHADHMLWYGEVIANRDRYDSVPQLPILATVWTFRLLADGYVVAPLWIVTTIPDGHDGDTVFHSSSRLAARPPDSVPYFHEPSRTDRIVAVRHKLITTWRGLQDDASGRSERNKAVKRFERFKNAWSYFDRVYTHWDLEDRVQDAWSALEALWGASNSNPISTHVPRRIAQALAKSDSERIEMARKLKRSYDLRSRRSHGDLHRKSASGESELLRFTIDVLRQSLLRCLDHDGEFDFRSLDEAIETVAWDS